MPKPLDPAVAAALDALGGRLPEHVFLAACGGSLAIMHPAKMLLDRRSRLPSDALNAAELVARRPRRLGPGALVVLCSMTGGTRETVAAARAAREAGALTVGLTTEPASALGKVCHHVVPFEAHYTTGVPIDAADSNYARLYELLLGLAQLGDGDDGLDALLASLPALQTAIDRAQERFMPLWDEAAPRLAHEPTIYALAGGYGYGAAYAFSTCVLMEMQRYASQAIHADEFFHGPFEVTDPSSAFVLLKSLGASRAMEERAEAFLHRMGDPSKVLTLDAASLDLSGIHDELRAPLMPLVFFDCLWRFAHRLAELRGIPMLTGRRYMKVLDDY